MSTPGAVREWPDSLDVGALLAEGFQPLPFRQFVLKLSSRCDLACDYCYMYEFADQSWRTKPARMSSAVAGWTVARIGEHARRHHLRRVEVILHGGEPLLAGPEAIASLVTGLRRELAGRAVVDVGLQTNGTRLDETMLTTLAEGRVRVGISLDGGRAQHDLHRRYADGRGSFDRTRAGVDRLRAHHPDLFAGILCTVDLRNDPVETYRSLLDLDPPAIDFLLPHGTWTVPPPKPDGPRSRTPYGDWLVAVFDRWYGEPQRPTRIRFFEEIMHLLLGGASRVETIGVSPSATVVVDTDGEIQQVDSLRIARDGAVESGHHVRDDAFDAVLTHPGIIARQLGVAALSDVCRACPAHPVCGAGYYPHRYQAGTGFRNPSVYGRDLFRLIAHVRERLAHDLPALKPGQRLLPVGAGPRC